MEAMYREWLSRQAVYYQQQSARAHRFAVHYARHGLPSFAVTWQDRQRSYSILAGSLLRTLVG